MYEVRNAHNDTVYKNENGVLAKKHADYLHEQNPNLHYEVVEVQSVYTTSTLEDALRRPGS